MINIPSQPPAVKPVDTSPITSVDRPIAIQVMKWVKAEPQQYETTFPQLVSWLTAVERTDRPKAVEENGKVTASQPGWCPFKMVPAPQLNTFGNVQRIAKNVESVQALVFDFDKKTSEEIEDLRQRLEGIRHCWHSTFSHQPISGKLCYRVIIDIDRPVPGAQWKRFFATAAEMFGAANDDSCSDPCRFYYGPHCPADGPEPESGYSDGFALPVDTILAEISKQPAAQIAPVSEPLTHAAIRALVPKNLESIPNENTRKGYQGIQNLLDGEPFAERGERHTTALLMSGILSRAFPNHSPEAIVAPLAHVLPHDDDKIPADQALTDMLRRDLAKIAEEREEKLAEALGEGRFYTEEETAGFLRSLGLKTKDALKRVLLVVTPDGRTSVLMAPDKGGPLCPIRYKEISGPESVVSELARRFLAQFRQTLDVKVIDFSDPKRPQGRPLTAEQLRAAGYGFVGAEFELHYRRTRIRFAGDTIEVPMFPDARHRQPKRNPQLWRYLEIGFGHIPGQLDVLLDTLPGTAPDQVGRKAGACIVFVGLAGTAKSALAKGISYQYCHISGFDAVPLLSPKSERVDGCTSSPIALFDDTIPHGGWPKLLNFTQAQDAFTGKGEKYGKLLNNVRGTPIFVALLNREWVRGGRAAIDRSLKSRGI